MKIEIINLSEQELRAKNVFNWGIWEKEVSKFDWFYDSAEYCYVIEGKVIVSTDEEEIEINKGDFVKFPKGLKCVWDIKENIKKYYSFE